MKLSLDSLALPLVVVVTLAVEPREAAMAEGMAPWVVVVVPAAAVVASSMFPMFVSSNPADARSRGENY